MSVSVTNLEEFDNWSLVEENQTNKTRQALGYKIRDRVRLIGAFTKCRDFFNDILFSRYLEIDYEIFGYHFNKDKTNYNCVISKTETYEQTETLIESSKLLFSLEKDLGIKRSELFLLENKTEIGFKINSTFWKRNPALIHFYTLILKLLTREYTKDFNTFQELCAYIEEEDSEILDKESQYLKSIVTKFSYDAFLNILKEVQKLTDEGGYYDLWEDENKYARHNTSGISTLMRILDEALSNKPMKGTSDAARTLGSILANRIGVNICKK